MPHCARSWGDVNGSGRAIATKRRAAASVIVAVAAAAIAGTGCSGEDAVISERALPRLVLQPSDLAAEFARFDEGRQVRADAPPGPRADPQRFGRLGGWKARYRRSGSVQTRGALVVESRADVFSSTDGARDDFAALRDELAATSAAATAVSDPDLGDEAAATTFVQGTSPSVRFFRIAWREENVVASVFANGFEGRFRLADALELARKQQIRVAAAADR